jgi:hypothetical protein
MTQQNTQEIDFSQLLGLTEAQRLDARETARRNAIRRVGERPQRAQFEHHTASKYPPFVRTAITGFMLLLLIAAFMPSAFRIYRVASHTFGKAITDPTQQDIAGVAFVLLAELACLGFVIAAGTLDIGRKTRGLLYLAAIVSTLIACIGNVQVAIQHTPGAWTWFTQWIESFSHEPFSWFEAIAPPVFTLIAGLVLKEIGLESIQRRHENERAYQQALADWKTATADPEALPSFRPVYANALRDQLQRVNAKGRGRDQRIAVMHALSTEDWRALVQRELAADSWFAEPAHGTLTPATRIVPDTDIQERHSIPLSESPAVGRNGHN